MKIFNIDLFTTRGSGQYPDGVIAEDIVISPISAESSMLQRTRAVPVEDQAIAKNVDYKEVYEEDLLEQPYNERDLDAEAEMEFIQGIDQSLAVERIGPVPEEPPMGKAQGDKPPMDGDYSFQGKGVDEVAQDPNAGKDGAFADGAGMNYNNGEPGDPIPGDPVSDEADVAAGVPGVGAGLPWLAIGIAGAFAWFFLKK